MVVADEHQVNARQLLDRAWRPAVALLARPLKRRAAVAERWGREVACPIQVTRTAPAAGASRTPLHARLQDRQRSVQFRRASTRPRDPALKGLPAPLEQAAHAGQTGPVVRIPAVLLTARRRWWGTARKALSRYGPQQPPPTARPPPSSCLRAEAARARAVAAAVALLAASIAPSPTPQLASSRLLLAQRLGCAVLVGGWAVGGLRPGRGPRCESKGPDWVTAATRASARVAPGGSFAKELAPYCQQHHGGLSLKSDEGPATPTRGKSRWVHAVSAAAAGAAGHRAVPTLTRPQAGRRRGSPPP